MIINMALLHKFAKIFFYDIRFVYLVVNFSGIEEVEHLHHHECVEDEGEVSRVYVCLWKYLLVVVSTVYLQKSARAGHPTITVLVLGLKTWWSVPAIRVLRDNPLSPENQQDQNYDLEDCLPCNMFVHCRGNNVVISFVRFPLEKCLSRRLCCQSKRPKCIHNEVQP